MRIGIDLGHGNSNDGGAVGIVREEDLINEVGAIVIAGLEAAGHKILLCRPSKTKNLRDSLQQRVTLANMGECDYFVSIHFNCFNKFAHGAEVFAISAKGKKLANSVLTEICKLGFANRGVKDGSHLFVVKNTNMPAILIEGCFIDSKKDMEIYDKAKMAEAILKGLTKVVGDCNVEKV
jgi:N-acetylmuramoyl-L-alanine amidase